MSETDSWTREQKAKYWKDKWVREHKIAIIVSLVLTPAVVYLVYVRKFIELGIGGWILLLLFLWAADLYYFYRRMKDYVRLKLEFEDDPEGELKQDIKSNLR